MSINKFTTQVGCGAGNSIFPLVSTYPGTFIHACDFSPRAIDLVKVWFFCYFFFYIFLHFPFSVASTGSCKPSDIHGGILEL